MDTKTLVVVCLTGSLLLTSCATGEQRGSMFGNAASTNEVNVVYNRDAARVLVFDKADGCPVKIMPEERPVVFVPLLLAITPVVANVAVGAISTYLEQMQNDLTANYVALGATDLFETDGSLSKTCLVIARGLFGSTWVDERNTSPGSLTRTTLEKYGFAAYPSLYIQAALEQDQNRKFSVTIRPEILHYADTAARRDGSGEKTIGVFLTLNTSAPTPARETAEEGAIATVPFEFRDVPIGTEYRIEDGQNPRKSPLFEQRRAVSFQPTNNGADQSINLYAFITETEDTPAFYKLLNDAFTANKPGLEKALQEVISEAIKEGTGEGS